MHYRKGIKSTMKAIEFIAHKRINLVQKTQASKANSGLYLFAYFFPTTRGRFC